MSKKTIEEELDEHKKMYSLHLCNECGAVTEHPRVLRSNPSCFQCGNRDLEKLDGI